MEKQGEGMELECGLEIINDTIRDVNRRLKAKGLRLEAKLKIKRLRPSALEILAANPGILSSFAREQGLSSQSAHTD